MKMSDSPLERGKGRQALGWVIARGQRNPTPALRANPPKEGIFRRAARSSAAREWGPESGNQNVAQKQEKERNEIDSAESQ